jgi:HD-like signal output (HDOD) protein
VSEKSLKDLIEEQFESDTLKLPVFNRVALELLKLKDSDNVHMDQIANLIMKDQSLVTRVLQVANSSFYAGFRPVDTISAALMRLGTERVSNLAMVASQLLAHTAQTKAVAPYLSGLWRRSFICATGGRWLANQTGNEGRAEEAFLAGLLHDIGELFLVKVLEKLSQNREHPVVLTDALMGEILETMHTGVGYRLMVKWDLPETYARVARDHHDPQFDEGDVLLIITRLLDIVCQKHGIGQMPEPDIVLAATPEAQALGLKEIKLAQLEVLLEDAVADVQQLL